MTAAVLRAELPFALEPREQGELPPAAATSQAGDAESPRESKLEAWGGEGGARPGAALWPLALEGEEGAREPLLDPCQLSAAPPSPPLAGGLCPAPAPLSPVPAAGRSPSPVAPWALPRLERPPSLSCGGPGEPAESEAGSAKEEECPICTEPYDRGRHTRARLNCHHVLCSDCLCAILERAGAADISRVRCPICRQKTLEHHFQVRFHTGSMFGCLPCVRYPLCLVSLLLIFLPIVLLVLLFLILDK